MKSYLMVPYYRVCCSIPSAMHMWRLCMVLRPCCCRLLESALVVDKM